MSTAAKEQPRLLGPTGLAMSCLALIAFTAMFFRWMLKQHDHSWGSLEDWGHAYVMPFLAGYLIWLKRAEIAAERVRPFWPGMAPFLLGLMSYLFFIVGVPNHMLQGAAMVLTLLGLALLVTGPLVFRHLFLPILFLLLAITISEQIMIKVTFQLQLIASKGAWLMLNIIGGIFGFLVDLEGNTLTVAGAKLNVAEACSGMRMVVAFYALAAAVGVMGCRHWWQRIALLLLAAPVAIFMNVVRVTVLGLLSLRDPNLAAGDAHMMIGTLLLVPSLALFLAVVWTLNRLVDDERAPGGSPA
ncbi:MAG: exosortase/archaeosortase family protein [Phycisphaerales bacterium]